MNSIGGKKMVRKGKCEKVDARKKYRFSNKEIVCIDGLTLIGFCQSINRSIFIYDMNSRTEAGYL